MTEIPHETIGSSGAGAKAAAARKTMDQSAVSFPLTSGASLRWRVLGSRRFWLLGAVAALGLAILAFTGFYFSFFRGSSVKPLQLSPSKPSNAFLAAGSVTGTWTITHGSVAGYRVREKLAFLPAESDAVGRTSHITGTIKVATRGSSVRITSAKFTANVRTLKSDTSRRDHRIHTLGLESDRYPTAGFKLTKPIPVPAGAFIGQIVHVPGTGRLTIHGTTRTVTIPLTGHLAKARIEVVGSITFPFSKFGMEPPNVAGLVTVEDHATMEFDLKLKHGK